MGRTLSILPVVILLTGCVSFRSDEPDSPGETPFVAPQDSPAFVDSPNEATLSAALTQFASIPTLTHIPTLTPEPRVTATPIPPLAQVGPITAPPVDFSGITFTYDPDLAVSWSGITRVDDPSPPAGGEAFWLPMHVEITLAGYPSMETYFNPAWPEIWVFPTAGFEGRNPAAIEQVSALRERLQNPSNPSGEMPELPITMAASAFTAQIRDLEFENGQGIRYVSNRVQDIYPVVNDTLYYGFQGLTEDEAYYVAMYFPISHDALPTSADVEADPPGGSREAFRAGFEEYLRSEVRMLDASDASRFAPDLARLDALVESLQIQAGQ